MHAHAPRLLLAAVPLLLALPGCSNPAPGNAGVTPDPASSTASKTTSTAAANTPMTNPGDTKKAAPAGPEVGKAAPDFTLNDLDGKPVSLASLKGKIVVLEWYNPDCPFVKMSHTKGSLKGYADKAIAKGVTWIAINSSATGKQGSDPERNKGSLKEYDLHHAVLLDPTGEVGKKYAATNTPGMYVIAADGTLAYRGAIDNSPDGEGDSTPKGEGLVNYVDVAITSLQAGKPVATPVTKPYGCSVKYGS